jgi:hypothetical protein
MSLDESATLQSWHAAAERSRRALIFDLGTLAPKRGAPTRGERPFLGGEVPVYLTMTGL